MRMDVLDHWRRRLEASCDRQPYARLNAVIECLREAQAAGADAVEELKRIALSGNDGPLVAHCDWEKALDCLKDPAGAKSEAAGLEVVPFSEIKAKPIRWLWQNRIALGKVTVLAGDGGLGKSTILCDLAARTSNGSAWPDGVENRASGSVLILAAEDAEDDTIKPRLEAHSADMNKVHCIRAVREGEGERRPFNLQLDLGRLRESIDRIGDVRLVIIDPVTSYLGKVDSHKNAEVRGVLEPLGSLAAETGVAIVCNNHFSKGSGGANSRIIGSVAFVNQARAAFIVTKDAEDEDRRLFIPSKMNIAALGEGLAYRIGGYLAQCDGVEIPTSQICWEGSVSVSADSALAALNQDDEAASAKDQAASFLEAVLADGPVDQKEVKALAAAQAIAWATVRRAKEGLVSVEKVGFGKDSRWVWSLAAQLGHPSESAEPPKVLKSAKGAQASDVSTLAQNEHLSGTESADPADWPVARLERDLPLRGDDPEIPPFLDRRPNAGRAA